MGSTALHGESAAPVPARLTRSARTSAGVRQPRVLRGRALSSAATWARCSTECTDRSLPLGSTGAAARSTLLCLSSCPRCGDPLVVDRGCGCLDAPIETAGDGPFEAASNVFVSLSFAPALQLVGDRFWMATHPGDGDGVERTVEVSVAAAVEAVPCPLPAARFQRCRAGEGREGRLAADASTM